MIIHSFRQEFVSKQVLLQWSRYKYTVQVRVKVHNIKVQVMVHCSGTMYRYRYMFTVKVQWYRGISTINMYR